MDERVHTLYVCTICGKICACNRGNCGDCLYYLPCAYRRSNLKRKLGDLCHSCALDELLRVKYSTQKTPKKPRPDLSIKHKRKKKKRRKR